MTVLSGGGASADAPRGRVISGRYMLARREAGPFGAAGKTVDQYAGETVAERACDLYGSWNSRVKTEIPGSMKKLLFIVLSIVAGGMWSCGGDSGGNTNNPAFTGACAKLPPPSAQEFKKRFDGFAMHRCYAKQGWKHDAERSPATSSKRSVRQPHPLVSQRPVPAIQE